MIRCGVLEDEKMTLTQLESLLHNDPLSVGFLLMLMSISIVAAVIAVAMGSYILRDNWRGRLRGTRGEPSRHYRLEPL